LPSPDEFPRSVPERTARPPDQSGPKQISQPRHSMALQGLPPGGGVLTVSPPGQVRLVNPESGLPKSRHGCPALLGERVPAFRHRRPVCRGQTAGLRQRHRRIAPQTDVPAASVNYYALHPRLRFRPADIEIKASPVPVSARCFDRIEPGDRQSGHVPALPFPYPSPHHC
jgi:hypothetical protein